MANYIGAVKFKDGALLYFVFQGNADMAYRKLYATEEAALDARDSGAAKADSSSLRAAPGGEPVEVMPYYCHGSDEVSWESTADRAMMVFTGPVDSMEADHDDSGPDGFGGAVVKN